MAIITANTGTSLAWEDTGTWVGGVVPSESQGEDTAIIPSGSSVVIDGISVWADIEIQAGGSLRYDDTAPTFSANLYSNVRVIGGTLLCDDSAATFALHGYGLVVITNGGSVTYDNGAHSYGGHVVVDGTLLYDHVSWSGSEGSSNPVTFVFAGGTLTYDHGSFANNSVLVATEGTATWINGSGATGSAAKVLVATGAILTGEAADISLGKIVTDDVPATSDVRDGVLYASGELEGTLQLPTEAQVLDGVGFGAAGTEFSGTLDVAGAEAAAAAGQLATDVAEVETHLADIRQDVVVLTGAAAGTLDITADNPGPVAPVFDLVFPLVH